MVHDSYQTLAAAVQETLARLPELRASVRRVHNRAVFEVPQILEQLMNSAGADPSRPAMPAEMSFS